MDKETDRRRSWLWKKKNGFGDGGTSPTPVKLFDEQEVGRMLEDQVRSQQEQMDSTLREVDKKYSENEKMMNEKLDTMNKKLTSALAEITAKDNLVKQHIKVAEEAFIGWERADNEAAAFKLQFDDAFQQKLAMEDRVQHLDNALIEVMKQLRIAREEHEQHIHEITVKKMQEYDELRAEIELKEQHIHETIMEKTQENDELRAEMESKLAEASHILDQTRAEMESKLAEASHIVAQTRAELMESRAENQALSNALQERSGTLAEVSDARTRGETNIKVLQERLEGMKKENFDLKNDIRLVTKRLESQMAELEHARKATDVVTRQLTEALKKATKLDEECTRLRAVVRKKLPSNTAIARLKQDADPSGRDAGKSPCKRPLGRSQSGADQEENLQLYSEAKASAEKILSLQEETRILKEALGQRDEELQRARIMCAKTASRLSSVEEEVEALKLAMRSASQVEKASLDFELMDDFEEMERMANSQSPPSLSVSGSEHTVEAAAVFGGVDDATYQPRIAGLEEALAAKDRDLETANRMCHELSTKLAVAEEQLVFLQTKNAVNEQSVIDLQHRLASLLEIQARRSESDEELAQAVQKLVYITEALAQATGTESRAATLDHHETRPSMSNSIVLSLHWQDPTMDTSMSSLVLAANAILRSGGDVWKFLLELTTTLDSILIIHIAATEELRKDRDASAEERLAVSMELESARVQVSQLEVELCRVRAEQADAEKKVQVEMDKFPQFEAEIMQLKADKNELENNLSKMDQHLVEANDRVEGLRVRLSEAETLVTELQTHQVEHDNEKEEDLLERELLELSDPGLRLAANMRAADAEMHELHDKVAALEVELHGERRRHQEVIAKLEDLQEQIHRGVGRVNQSLGSSSSKNGDQLLQLALVEDDETKSARKEKDIAAAALAECQRTILALGKQLKVLGLQEPSDIFTQTNSPASPDSIEQMTQTMEFLRSQADSNPAPSAPPGTSLTWAPRAARPALPALPGLYYRQNNNGSGHNNGTRKPTDGPLLLSIELPDSSNPDSTSLASQSPPARVLRSVRTIRASTSMKTSVYGNIISSANAEEIPNLESRSTLQTTSTFKRFYSRSKSETSMSSGHSNPEPV